MVFSIGMKQVVIRTGGKQYLVSEGQQLAVEKLPVETGETVTFDEVLAVVDGAESKFGQPLLAEAKVEAQVLKQGKAKKIRVEKFANKTRFHRTAGHQQLQTEVKITSIKA